MRKVRLKVTSADTTYVSGPNNSISSEKEVFDIGTGFILKTKVLSGGLIHQIAVIDGRFDAHRNDLGELWVNTNETDNVEE